MQDQAEIEFNLSVANILTAEYEKETGVALRLVPGNQDYPDLILERISDGQRLDVELVEVLLAFLNREHGELRKYETRLAEVLKRVRPVLKDRIVGLQLSETAVSASRPHTYPNVNGKDAAAMFDEFANLLEFCGDEIVTNWGGLLLQYTAKPGAPAIPTLEKHFNAIFVSELPATHPGRSHPDDPVIDLRTAILHLPRDRNGQARYQA